MTVFIGPDENAIKEQAERSFLARLIIDSASLPDDRRLIVQRFLRAYSRPAERPMLRTRFHDLIDEHDRGEHDYKMVRGCFPCDGDM